jgi:hypothetical protein
MKGVPGVARHRDHRAKRTSNKGLNTASGPRPATYNSTCSTGISSASYAARIARHAGWENVRKPDKSLETCRYGLVYEARGVVRCIEPPRPMGRATPSPMGRADSL